MAGNGGHVSTRGDWCSHRSIIIMEAVYGWYSSDLTSSQKTLLNLT